MGHLCGWSCGLSPTLIMAPEAEAYNDMLLLNNHSNYFDGGTGGHRIHNLNRWSE